MRGEHTGSGRGMGTRTRTERYWETVIDDIEHVALDASVELGRAHTVGGRDDVRVLRADAVAKRLLKIREDLGLSGFLFEPNVGGATPRECVFRSVELLAREVVPALR